MRIRFNGTDFGTRFDGDLNHIDQFTAAFWDDVTEEEACSFFGVVDNVSTVKKTGPEFKCTAVILKPPCSCERFSEGYKLILERVFNG